MLSFFDGIGTAFEALRQLGMEPLISWSFETDPDCTKVCGERHPTVQHMGDALCISPHAAASRLAALAPESSVVLVTAAPPCPDFSSIKGDNALGPAGPEGQKFVKWAKWLQEFKQVAPFQVVSLVENVVMQHESQTQVEQILA